MPGATKLDAQDNLKKEFFAKAWGRRWDYSSGGFNAFKRGQSRRNASKGNMKLDNRTKKTARLSKPYLSHLGVYGFEKSEILILAALVTEDPLLLIGASGTGKTYLLNSISEALGLEHRHYNASLVSFDDLVGFPFPDSESSTVKFLETPATIWGAQSVLVDEISRCRPEHQNRLFSLIHERRVQGIPLSRLRFRWAAMNPCSADQGGDYAGSEPLDRALADRFGLIVTVGDWQDLSKANKRKVADPSGEGALSNDQGRLSRALVEWQQQYQALLDDFPGEIVDYACAAATALADAKIRLSPRRVRMMTRSLLAATVVSGCDLDAALFRLVLESSIPHLAWGEELRKDAINAAHQFAWDSVIATGDRKWIHEFHLETSLAGKVKMLLNDCPSADAGSSAIAQMIASDRPERVAAFAMALYPAAAKGLIPSIGAEGVADLGRIAQPVLAVNAKLTWSERLTGPSSSHPEIARSAKVLKCLSGARQERANQLFKHLIANEIAPESFSNVEAALEACVRAIAQGVRK